MARLSVNETTTFRWSFEEDVIRYAEAGIPAMGVWRHKLSDFGVARGVEFLAEHGVEASHLFWVGGFTGSDGRSFRESVEDAQEAIREAAELQAGSLVLYSGARGSHTANHAQRLLKLALEELLPQADALGVDLALEPMHPGCAAEWTFLTSLEDVLRVIDRVSHPRMKMVFDVYHLGHDPEIVARVPELLPHVALIQLGDAQAPPQGEQNRCLLGQGVLPLGPLVEAFRQGGYDGYYDVELLGEALEETSYETLLDHAKESFARLVEGETP